MLLSLTEVAKRATYHLAVSLICLRYFVFTVPCLVLELLGLTSADRIYLSLSLPMPPLFGIQSGEWGLYWYSDEPPSLDDLEVVGHI